jgi:hypothetical protein
MLGILYDKDLNDPLTGNKTLNRLGLHRGRMQLADRCNALRIAIRGSMTDNAAAALRRDGCVAVPDFLPPEQFSAVAEESERVAAGVEAEWPMTGRNQPGFGEKKFRDWGYDRYDGGTLNRFITIDPLTMPACHAAASAPRLTEFTRAAIGMRMPRHKVSIYITRHGGETDAHDDQKDMHRDTFHASVKFWYFLRDVRPEDGPFIYVPGSHRLGKERMAWEHARVIEMIGRPRGKRAAAFRIPEDALGELGYGPPQHFAVPANTLVLADTLGFHRRGDATGPAIRLSLYGFMRPWPFQPIGF